MSPSVLQRRAAAARSTRIRLLLVAVGAVVVIAGAIWAILFSSWLTVDEVHVEGVAVLTVDEVLAAAAVPSGASLVRLDTGDVADRVDALVPVREVSVSRQWPSTILITVVERQPALAVPSEQGFAIYDRDGVRYLEVIAPPEGVPQLVSAEPDEDALRGVLDVLAALPDPLLARLATVRAETADSIELDLTDGVVVVWGSAEDSARKAEVLTALMKQPGRVYIVSAPDVPAIRP